MLKTNKYLLLIYWILILLELQQKLYQQSILIDFSDQTIMRLSSNLDTGLPEASA